jgi:SAM-dependent methyltransferase
MKIGDYLIQDWRMRISARWIPTGSRVLDIGCHQGEFLTYLGNKISPSVGIDPLLNSELPMKQHQLLPWVFRDVLPFKNQSFDVISLLATIEHLYNQEELAKESWRLLKPGGRVVITMPSQFVDKILEVFKFFRFVDGMSLEEHHGLDVKDLPVIFEQEGFILKEWRTFQLGMNNLIVFER